MITKGFEVPERSMLGTRVGFSANLNLVLAIAPASADNVVKALKHIKAVICSICFDLTQTFGIYTRAA